MRRGVPVDKRGSGVKCVSSTCIVNRCLVDVITVSMSLFEDIIMSVSKFVHAFN